MVSIDSTSWRPPQAVGMAGFSRLDESEVNDLFRDVDGYGKGEYGRGKIIPMSGRITPVKQQMLMRSPLQQEVPGF